MDKSDYVIKYFEGTLSKKELEVFNTLLISNNEFKEDFEFQKELRATLVLNDREELKKEIQDWDKTTDKRSLKSWFVAASIIAILTVPSLWYFGQTNLSNEDLYATNFKPFKNVVYPIVRGQNSDDLKAKAFIAYEAQNYEEALNTFDVLLNTDNDSTILFYKAITLLELNKNDIAISIFTNNHNIPNILKAQQQWYLTLAYIKTNKNSKAKSSLKELIDDGSYKKKEAEQLLKHLAH